MKILAVRGENLASLAAPFALDFSQPPLSRSGLFAISGPTGSGKSTILDAICLALFNAIPRLPGKIQGAATRKNDQDAGLQSDDSRSILRHGTAGGFAEVDFRGIDKQAYRVRWEVRRARQKSDGTLQKPSVSLVNITTQQTLSTGKLTETLQLVEEKLGLSFEQFRRSVLLPQGDFAAFLKAPRADRSLLLERMTGVEIYSRLSMAAHVRARTEEERVRQIILQMEAYKPLSPAEREEQVARRVEAQATMDSHRKDLERLNIDLQWFTKQEELHQKLAEAAQEVFQAKRAFLELDADRKRLEEIKAVQLLRSPLQELDGLEGESRDAQNRMHMLNQDILKAQADIQHQEESLKSFLKGLLTAQQEEERQAPFLARARVLDAQLLAQKAAFDEQVGVLTRSESLAREMRQCLETTSVTLNGQKAALGATVSWLKKNEALGLLVEEWGSIRREFDRFQTAREELNTATEQVERAGQVLKELEARRRQAEEASQKVSQALEQAAGNLRKHSEAARPFDLGALYPVVDREKEMAEKLRRLQDALQKFFQAEKDRDDLTREQQENTHRQRLLEKETLNHQLDLEDKTSKLEGAEQQKDLLGVANLGETRARLRAGAPCPVCGSKDHPWSDKPPPTDEEVRNAIQGFAALSQQIADLQGKITGNQARINELQRQNEKIAPRLADMAPEIDLLKEDIGNKAQAAGVAVTKIDSHFAVFLSTRLQEVEAKIDEARSRIQQGGELQKLVSQCQAEVERCQAELAREQKELQDAQMKAREGQLQFDALQKRLAEQEGAKNAILMTLYTSFSNWKDWQGQLENDPAGFLKHWEKMIREFREKRDEKDSLNRLIAAQAPDLAILETEWKNASALEAKERTKAESERQKLEALSVERQGFFNGRTTDEWEQELKRRTRGAEEALNQAKETTQELQKKLSETRTSLIHWTNQQKALQEKITQKRNGLDVHLKSKGIDLTELRHRLTLSDDWVQATSDRLKKVQSQLETSFFMEKERQKEIEEHFGQKPTTKSRETLEVESEHLEKAINRLQEDLISIASILKLDDEKQQRFQGEREKLETMRKDLDTWQKLNALIGSADGKKFREFAQGMTFEHLLQLANRHLAELFPRYQLQKIPGTDLELQIIDRDLGDEIRSVHNLSGGESFIVSLALALGLAWLSADKIQIESLFIDEGFGSLDLDSLDLVLTSLDALQASGRQVAVISHVPSMIERIGIQVKVLPEGAGRSTVRVCESFAP